MTAPLVPRLATLTDLPAITALQQRAIVELQRAFLSDAELDASFTIMGLDTQLIADSTYYVVERAGELAGCGGWSRRATLFGGDHSPGRDAALLDPSRDPARVRAMYTHPDFARRGVGRLLLQVCESAAAREGFRRAELASTLAGEALYAACGYEVIERFAAPTPRGVPVPLIRMGKKLPGA